MARRGRPQAGIPEIDVTRPNRAQVKECLLAGGKDAFAASRDLARKILDPLEGYPDLRRMAHAHRRFMLAAVTWAASEGIGQFIDTEAGYPEPPTIHHTARAVLRDARVVYADTDPVVLSHLAALAAGEGIGVADADELDLAGLLRAAAAATDPGGGKVLDMRRPVAVLMMGTLNRMAAGDARKAVRRCARALPQGSVLAVTCGICPDPGAWERLSGAYTAATGATWVNHSAEDVASFLAGLADPDGGPVQAADAERWPVPFTRWALEQAAPTPGPHVTGAIGIVPEG